MGELVLHDPGRHLEIPLSGRIRIGRDRECELVLEEPKASRRHAEISPEGGGWILRDLGSRNGTQVNGRRLEAAHRLSPGDRISIGGTELEVRGAAARLAAAGAGPGIVSWILAHAALLAFFAGCAWLSRWGFSILLCRWVQTG